MVEQLKEMLEGYGRAYATFKEIEHARDILSKEKLNDLYKKIDKMYWNLDWALLMLQKGIYLFEEKCDYVRVRKANGETFRLKYEEINNIQEEYGMEIMLIFGREKITPFDYLPDDWLDEFVD